MSIPFCWFLRIEPIIQFLVCTGFELVRGTCAPPLSSVFDCFVSIPMPIQRSPQDMAVNILQAWCRRQGLRRPGLLTIEYLGANRHSLPDACCFIRVAGVAWPLSNQRLAVQGSQAFGRGEWRTWHCMRRSSRCRCWPMRSGTCRGGQDRSRPVWRRRLHIDYRPQDGLARLFVRVCPALLRPDHPALGYLCQG